MHTGYNSGDTAWLLVSTALVMFMTPGLALFYGGMVKAKNVLAIMMQNFIAIAVITVIWVVLAYSMAFNHSILGGFIGKPSLNLGLSLNPAPALFHLTVPPAAFLSFQLMFAIITGALITGTAAERIKFSSYVVFIILWTILVYAPVAHWAFSPAGWLNSRGMLDFAGGTVVEINSGFSALGLLLALGPRRKWPKDVSKPHSVPLALAGAGIIWFGWFGFNAGSAITANASAALAFINTQIAASVGLIGWLLYERFKEGYATTLGAASGAIAGMVAITPCAGYVEPYAAIIIGLVAGVICSLVVRLKFKFKLDDSLDVLGVHGFGGLVGTILLGLFATLVANPKGGSGLLASGGFHLFGLQLLGAICSAAYCCVVSYLIALVVKQLIGLRVPEETEQQGLDLILHAETAYSGQDSGQII